MARKGSLSCFGNIRRVAISHEFGMWPGCMDEVNNLARWWNIEVVVPSLRTSLCIVSTPGAFLVLENLTNLIGVWVSISFTSSCSSLMSNLVISVFRKIKIFMIILYELVDFIGMIRIKVFALMPKCISTDLAKSCSLSAFVLATLSSWRSAG